MQSQADAYRDELAQYQRRLEQSLRAEHDGRMVDPVAAEHHRALLRKRIRDLETTADQYAHLDTTDVGRDLQIIEAARA